jgi:hypothetical protein
MVSKLLAFNLAGWLSGMVMLACIGSLILSPFVGSQIFSFITIPFIASFSVFILYTLTYMFLVNIGDKNRGSLEFWALMRRFIKADDSFPLAPGERIVMPLTPCVIQMSDLSWMTRDVIVTNKRVLVGFLFTPLLEIFGTRNYWFVGDIPELESRYPLINLLSGGDYSVSRIGAGSQNLVGDFLELFYGVSLPLGAPPWPSKVTIYHPRAKEIRDLFAKPLE